MTRIVPVTAPYDELVGPVLEAMMPAGIEPIALFRTFVRNPTMSAAMHPFGKYELGRELSLSMRDREIVINRTCARCGCEYEWGVHVAFFAQRVGLDGDQIRSLTHGSPDDGCWTESERVLIRAVDQLHDGSDIDDETWTALASERQSDELLDLLVLAGWYHAISYAANGARVEREPWAPGFADY